MRQGPLTSLRILEFAGIGPAPFCGMLLSDLGADVVRIDRKDPAGAQAPQDVIGRGRRSIALNLKSPGAREACLRLMETADALLEGFRPGAMERLGLGPEVALARNPKLVFGRMTGWGQTGPLADAAGHDLNYIAISGALHAIGSREQPLAPLNLVGDLGGGGLYMALGLLSAVLNARETGRGQVVDCAMSDGAASLMGMFYGMHSRGNWVNERRANISDGGSHFYDTYRCADGKWISIAAVEPRFYALLLKKIGLHEMDLPDQGDRSRWAEMKALFAARIAQRSQAEWCGLLEGTDACFAPVLDMDGAPRHAHNVARGTFVESDGVLQPSPAPRFSDTPGAIQGPPPDIGEHNFAALADWGLSPCEIEKALAT